MKYLFLFVAVILALASAATYLSYPDARAELPVLYWVTDANPARVEQIAIFHRWQIDQGHGKTYTLQTQDDLDAFRARHWTPPIARAIRDANPDGAKALDPDTTAAALPLTVRVPACEMRVDAANSDNTKKIIQCVTGIGGDVMDLWSGAGVRQFEGMGVLEPLNERAAAGGFGVSHTFPAIAPDLTVTDAAGHTEQYAFPCNVNASLLWVNKATFERFGQPLPPPRWTLEEFETLGRAYVAAANPPGQRRSFFYASGIDPTSLHRSMGVSLFNETLTKCTFDDPRHHEAIRKVHQWTYVDHILPTDADRASFSTDAGYGGADTQLFHRGNYAMMQSGRYMLIQFRKFGAMRLGVAEQPHAGMSNTGIATRCAAVYVGGRHKDLAALFLSYLASPDYNLQVVRDADALPPDPQYTHTEAYLRPPDFPNEWEVHGPFADAAEEISVPGEYSPFVAPSIVNRHTQQARDAVMNNRKTVEVACADAQVAIMREMEYALRESPDLRARHDRALADQQRIDDLLARGEKVPRSLVANPFHLYLYRQTGRLDEDR